MTWELAFCVLAVLILGIALSWFLGWTIWKPLAEMTDRLRTNGSRGLTTRFTKQPLAELQGVAGEFNKLADRLAAFEKINVDRLLYEKRKIEAIIESVEDGIILIDPDGITTHINELGAIIIGVEREDALGCRFDDLNSNHPHYLQVRAALHHAADISQNGNRIELNLHVRGREHNYLLKPMQMRENGSFFGTILILQDVTYFRDEERARRNLVETLSHELRAPLSAMNLAMEMMQRECPELDIKRSELAGVVTEEANRIRELTDDILDLTRSDINSIAVSNIELDLAGLVKRVVGKFESQAKEKRVRLNTHVQEPSLGGHGDPIKLAWVVSNLVGNALRYTPGGGAIDVFAERAGANLRVTVADTGPGIAPEIRDRIFERNGNSVSDRVESNPASVSLALVKEIVEAHGGRIFLDSSDVGSRFTVQLPIAERN